LLSSLGIVACFIGVQYETDERCSLRVKWPHKFFGMSYQ